MKRVILAAIFVLAGAVNAFGQSTTVSGTVTDAGSQAWTGGTYQFQFVPNPQFPTGPYTWTGGTLNKVISGSLDGSGAYSQSVPSNSAISPQGSKWILQVTSAASSPSFSTSTTTVTGGTQTLNVTPPAISIDLSSSPLGSFTRAYADAEITASPLGGQYYNVTSSLIRLCIAVSGQACTIFVNAGGGAGGTVSTTGSPVAGNLTEFSSPSTITNTDLSGDVTTAGTAVATVVHAPFSGLTTGTNATALHVGTGGSLDATGSGTITATNALAVNGNTYPASGAFTSGGVACATSTTVMTTSAALTANVLPKGGGAGACPTNSSVTDNGTTVSTAEPIVTTSTVASGSTPPTCTPGSGGGYCGTEGTAPTAAASVDDIHADSTQHAWMVNNNNTGEMAISRTLCVNVTPVTVAVNTTSDQLLQACTISANALNVVGHTLKVFMAGVYTQVVTAQPTIKLTIKLCTVSGCGSGTVISPITITSSATSATVVTNAPANISGQITTQTAGASSAYEAHGNMTVDLGAAITTAESVFADNNAATVGTIDSTGALFLQATVAFSSGSASNSFTGRQLIVELIN